MLCAALFAWCIIKIMETSPNQYTQPMSRAKRLLRFLIDRHLSEPTPAMSDHWKPSPQRDVGKSASEAAAVQLVLEGMEGYQSRHYTQPANGVGYTDRPDSMLFIGLETPTTSD